jgi:hypothetical protein
MIYKPVNVSSASFVVIFYSLISHKIVSSDLETKIWYIVSKISCRLRHTLSRQLHGGNVLCDPGDAGNGDLCSHSILQMVSTNFLIKA